MNPLFSLVVMATFSFSPQPLLRHTDHLSYDACEIMAQQAQMGSTTEMTIQAKCVPDGQVQAIIDAVQKAAHGG